MVKRKKSRNLAYEKKFRAYLFSRDYETHKKIAKHINVVPSTPATRKALRKRKR
jgi:hypothetical protein|tara:strand:+ start:308 stop:469 length:162 start_codon:yes stop_codon:yes gene_type:complete